MSSSNPKRNGGPKSVRFEESAGLPARKRPRIERPNPDEDDDVDEWTENDDDEEGKSLGLPSERDLVKAKRNRRRKREGQDLDDDDDDNEETHIDRETSLVADKDTEIPIEPFNMNAERTDGSGYFEGDTYIFRKRDEEDEPDAWLDSLKDDEHQKEEFAKPRATQPRRDGPNMDDWTKEELYGKILPLVSDSETILQALVRYGTLIKQNKTGEAAKLSHSALSDLTAASNALLLKGDVDIYQMTRNDIMKMIPEKAPQPENKPVVKWEYKGNQDGQVHGPYSTQEMVSWTQAGYFIGEQAVQVRTLQEGEVPEMSTADELLSDLMDDEDDKKIGGPLIKGDWVSSNDVNFQAYS